VTFIKIRSHRRKFSNSDSVEQKIIINCAVSNLIPEKSKWQCENCYSDFRDWCNNTNVKTVSENVVLAYLLKKSKILKSSSLWSTYSLTSEFLVVSKNNLELLRSPIFEDGFDFIAKK
jgi:hypothetical protein